MAAPARGPAKGPARGSSRGAAQSNPLLDPGATLSGPALNQAAHQIANAQTLDPIAELAKARAQQMQQGAGAQRQTAGYFNQLGQFATQGLNAQTGIANDLNSQLQGIADQTQQRIQGLGQGQLAQYSDRVGGDFRNVGMPSLANTLGQQQATALNNSQSFRDFGATQGANFRNLAAANLGVYASRGQEDLANIGRATRLALEPLNAKMAGLRAQQGSLYGTALGSLRSQERNFDLARGALGLRQQSLAATVQNNQARNALAVREQNIRARIASIDAQIASGRLNETQRHNLVTERTGLVNAQANLTRAQRAGGGGGGGKVSPGGLSATSQNKVYGQIDRLRALIRDGQQNGQTEAQIRQHLADGLNPSKQSYPAALIQAAYELDGWGFITPHTASQLYGMGLRGKGPYRISNPPQRTVGQSTAAGAKSVAGGVGNVLGL